MDWSKLFLAEALVGIGIGSTIGYCFIEKESFVEPTYSVVIEPVKENKQEEQISNDIKTKAKEREIDQELDFNNSRRRPYGISNPWR